MKIEFLTRSFLALNPGEELANVEACSLRVLHHAISFGELFLEMDLIFAFILDVFESCDAPVDKLLLGQHRLKDFLTIVEVNSMQVLCLDFLLGQDFDPVEAPQLGDVVENLAAVVLFVLDWVEAEVELRQQIQSLNELQLEHLGHTVQCQVQETQGAYLLEANKVCDVILAEIKLFEAAQIAQTGDPADLILGQMQLLQVQIV